MKASLYLSCKEAAAAGGVSRATVSRWLRHGVTVRGRLLRLEGERRGWRYRIPLESWDEFVRACSAGERRV